MVIKLNYTLTYSNDRTDFYARLIKVNVLLFTYMKIFLNNISSYKWLSNFTKLNFFMFYVRLESPENINWRKC